MAHSATLRLTTATGINRYDIIELEYSFSQGLNLGPTHTVNPVQRIGNMIGDAFSFVTSNVTGGTITMTLATPSDSDTIFHRWMFSRWRPMNGTIRVDMDSPDNSTRTLHIHFTGGYCTKLEDKFNSQNGKQMTTKITVTCMQIEIGKNIPAIWPAFI